MNVTAEQWAQAEAERQKQADVVQSLINDVRQLGTEQLRPKNQILSTREKEEKEKGKTN